MVNSWIFALGLTVLLASAVWYSPVWLGAQARKADQLSSVSDEFFEAVRNAALGPRPLPPRLGELASALAGQFSDPRMVRHLIWAAVRGKLSSEVEAPSQFARDVLKELAQLSEDQRKAMIRAVALALVASSLKAGVWGWFFLTFMVPGGKARTEAVTATVAATASVYVPEIARGSKLLLAA